MRFAGHAGLCVALWQGMLGVGLKAQVLDASATQAGKTYADSQYESPFRRVNIRS